MQRHTPTPIFGNNDDRGTKIVKVKVCGIATLKDLELAIVAGADAVGFLVHRNEGEGSSVPLQHRLTWRAARELVSAVPGNVTSVLLIHTSNPDVIAELCQQINPSAIQIQTNVSDSDLAVVKTQFPNIGVIKTVHVYPDSSIDEVVGLAEMHFASGIISAINLDSREKRTSGRSGGTGVTHNWNISASVVKRVGTGTVILAGGLDSDNVRRAVESVRPHAVDVMTGVEEVRGVKSQQKLESFFAALRRDQ
ncbi:MAG TPA: phosphoribosylanthranilate isomerase [Candidatus Angelobacter sp.]|nr:phosphoribosylanthranilate isomerase [Candidatus Angelobacter sp.]